MMAGGPKVGEARRSHAPRHREFAVKIEDPGQPNRRSTIGLAGCILIYTVPISSPD